MKTLFALAAIPIALIFSPPAHADQWDFVAVLDNNGVYYDNIIDVIDTGKKVCRALREGMTVPDVGGHVMGEGFTSTEAGIILLAATATMCSDQQAKIDAAIKASQGQLK